MGLKYAPAAPAFLASLPPTPKRHLRAALNVLSHDARDARGLDVRRLDGPTGVEPLYRVRVGDYRIVFGFSGKDVLVVKIFHRRDGYGWLERV